MATKRSAGGSSRAAATTPSPTRGLSFDEFVQIAVKSATAATKTLGPHPIWIGIIIRPPELENPEVIAGGTNR
jgi:hypothetical protein